MKHVLGSIMFFLLLTVSIESCTSTMSKIYGLKEIKVVDDGIILETAKTYKIPEEDIFELDTSYISYLYSFDTSLYKIQIKNHYQPLQALYFDKSGQLKSFHINCYAGGSLNLKWDRDSILNVFPPRQQAPLDSLLTLERQFKYLRPLGRTTIFNFDSYDYVVIIYWNRFMNRQSKRLINFIQENCKLANGFKVKMVYANNDNIFAKE